MIMKKDGDLKFKEGDTPLKAYERAMRYGAFHHAAKVAEICGLDKELVRQAAFKAFCRYDDLGMDDIALEIIREFGLTLLECESREYVKILQMLGEVPTDIPSWAVLPMPRENQ
jgi:hypothetical protein